LKQRRISLRLAPAHRPDLRALQSELLHKHSEEPERQAGDGSNADGFALEILNGFDFFARDNHIGQAYQRGSH
jgi:hypothetical protein